MKTLSALFTAVVAAALALGLAACSDDGPQVIICTEGPHCVPTVDYHIPRYPAPETLEADKPYVFTSRAQVEEHFPGLDLEPIDFSKYSLFFVHGHTRSNFGFAAGEVWWDGPGQFTIRSRVYTGIGSIIDNWNAAHLVPDYGKIDDVGVQTSFYGYNHTEELPVLLLDIPADKVPDELPDNRAVIISDPSHFESLFGYRPQGVDFDEESLIFIKGTATHGIEHMDVSLGLVDKGHYLGAVEITLDDTAAMTPWTVCLRVQGARGGDIADIAVNIRGE